MTFLPRDACLCERRPDPLPKPIVSNRRDWKVTEERAVWPGPPMKWYELLIKPADVGLYQLNWVQPSPAECHRRKWALCTQWRLLATRNFLIYTTSITQRFSTLLPWRTRKPSLETPPTTLVTFSAGSYVLTVSNSYLFSTRPPASQSALPQCHCGVPSFPNFIFKFSVSDEKGRLHPVTLNCGLWPWPKN